MVSLNVGEGRNRLQAKYHVWYRIEREENRRMKRIRSYDLIRVICFCFIIYYHMIVQLGIDGVYEMTQIAGWYENTNIHFGTIAVAVFFLLSGASLGLTAGEQFSVRTYYRKRLIRLLVPFYLCTIVCMGLVLATGIHFPGFEPATTPAWRIIFNVLGMDTWVSMFGISTFSLGLGEWFLGELMVFSILFPVFRILIRKGPIRFGIAAVLIYVGTLLMYGRGNFANVPIHMNLLLKGFEFILGIYLGMYRQRIPRAAGFAAVPVFLVLAFSPIPLPVSAGLKITMLALCFFLSFLAMEPFLQKKKLSWVNLLSSCSYEAFLCHHMVIYMVSKVLESRIHGIPTLLLFFLAELIGIAVVTLVLKAISDRIVDLLLGRRKAGPVTGR